MKRRKELELYEVRKWEEEKNIWCARKVKAQAIKIAEERSASGFQSLYRTGDMYFFHSGEGTATNPKYGTQRIHIVDTDEAVRWLARMGLKGTLKLYAKYFKSDRITRE